MDEMITFEKGFQDRLEEYMIVFGENETVPATQIKKQWSFYLELAIDSFGWKALWKISRLMCDKLDIAFPTVVIVNVNSINFNDLTADVQIVAVQGNLNLPSNHTASLTRLWPTKQQYGSTETDIISVANSLDMLRYFYYYLWMPWDLHENSNSDWVKNNLTDRLHLFSNIKEKNIPHNKARKIQSLLTEIKTILECMGDDGTSSINTDIPKNDAKTDAYIELNLKIVYLKTEMETIEAEIETYQLQNKLDFTPENNYWLVFNSGCTLDKYTEFLHSVENNAPTVIKYKSAVCLQDAVDSASPNDSIMIGPGKHKIHSGGVLDDGAVLKSVFQDRTQVIISSLHENSFADFSGSNLALENLSINIEIAQCGIIAQKGTILIKNCAISGQGSSFAQHGIVALPGSVVQLENCQISEFGIGFFISSFASLTLNNCVISNVQMPLKMSSTSSVELNNCKFKNYKKFGIYLESEPELADKTFVGDVSVLQTKLHAKIYNCSFECGQPNSTPVIIVNECMLT